MDWTAERVALLKRLRDEGVSYAAIAARLGISRGAVSGKVDRLGLAAREPAPRRPRKLRVRLKTRRVEPKASSQMVEALGPFILRDAREGRAPQDEGTVDAEAQEIPQDATAGRDPAGPDPQTSRACSLLELSEDTCRWPVGDVGEPGFYFCGQPPLEGRPYCGPHCRKAFRPMDAKPVSEFLPERDPVRVLQPDTRFGQFAHWDVT